MSLFMITRIKILIYPELVKKFYLRIDAMTINVDLNQFLIHLDHEDLLVTLETIEKVK